MADRFNKLAQQTRLNCGYKARVTAYRHYGSIYFSSVLAIFENPITGGYYAMGVYFSHQKDDGYESIEDAMAAGWDRIAEQTGGHRTAFVLSEWAA